VTVAARRSWFEKREAMPRAVSWRADGAEAEAHPPRAAEDETPRSGEESTPPAPAIAPELEALQAAEAAVVASEAALERTRNELSEARAALSATQAKQEELAADLRRAVTAMRDEAEGELVKLALAIAERVVGRELSIEPELVVQWAREVIAGSALGDHFELALSTELASSLDGESWGDLASFVSTDPALDPGTCEVRDGGKVITVDAKTRLDLVGEHLATSVESEAA
jgi:flagellar biosynthesis/type III secretory pathway protein FliH